MPDAYISVAEDLEELRTWGSPSQVSAEPSDPALRRGSAILRRFVPDQLLQHAWRAHGMHETIAVQPRVTAYLITPGVTPAGVSLHVIYADSQLEFGVGPLFTPGRHTPMRSREGICGLNQYRDSAAIQVNEWIITRGDLIKYFANVLGGVHLDGADNQPKRRKKPEAERRERALTARIASLEHQIKVLGRESLRFELREIGRRLAASQDLRLLEDRIRANG
jgi:hypothetical protein